MTKVSVLIAVYNTERYLHECLDSLLHQTLEEWEAICVDDASTDGSWAILQDYAARDGRFKVVGLKENHGQAFARNKALALAQGEYISFLDSDDWLARDALEKVVSCFEANFMTDCVLFQLRYFSDNDGRHTEWDYRQPHFGVMSGKEAFRLSLDWSIHGVYVVKAELHRRYPYDDSSRWYSDDNTTRLHYFASREVRECQGVYYYRQHSSSVSHAVDVHRFDYLEANASMRKMLLAMHSPKDVLDEYEICRWKVVVGMYMFYYKYRHELASKDRRTGLEKIRQAWKSIDPDTVRKHFGTKLGYCPLRFSWKLFRLQEEIYFSLRKLIGRL